MFYSTRTENFVINGHKCNKVASVIKVGHKCNKVTSVINRHKYNKVTSVIRFGHKCNKVTSLIRFGHKCNKVTSLIRFGHKCSKVKSALKFGTGTIRPNRSCHLILMSPVMQPFISPFTHCLVNLVPRARFSFGQHQERGLSVVSHAQKGRALGTRLIV